MSAKLLEKPTSKVAASVVDTPAFKTWFRGSKVVNTQGQPLVVYHGTTHEFDRFDVSKFSKEGAYGQALYFTSSGQDAGSNYATPDGPDITNRVEQLAETIFYDLPEVHENEPKRGSPEYLAAQEKAKAQARKELVGEHGGVVYLLFLRIQNPVVVKPSGGTYFEDPNRFLRAYRRAAESFHVDADLLLRGLEDGLSVWDGFSAWEFEQNVREGVILEEVLDAGGPGALIAATYRALGFDGVIQDPIAAFKHMKIPQGSMHYVVWSPTQVKSALGNKGTFNSRSPRLVAHIEHDVEDANGRVVKIALHGGHGPSFELFATTSTGGDLDGEMHVVGPDGERNHGTKPFHPYVSSAGTPLATAQRFANAVWQVIDQEYRELMDAAVKAGDRGKARILFAEARLRKQEVLGDIVDAFVPKPGNRWSGWATKSASMALTASSWRKAAEDAGVGGPALDQFYSIAAKIMQGGDVKTFDTFVQKVRDGLGPQFNGFLKALGGYTGLRPVWDAVVANDADDLVQSLEDMRISPRIPSAKQDLASGKTRAIPLEDPHGPVKLQPDVESMSRDDKALAKNVALAEQYPNFRGLAGKGDPKQRAEAIITQMKDNLIFLFNVWGKNLAERSRFWYVGGNRLTHRWAKRFNTDPHKIAGVVAALSPQQHWFQNITVAERVLSALHDHMDEPWDKAMTQRILSRDWGSKAGRNEPSPKDLLPELQGKTLRNLKAEGSLYRMAVWIRAWDEAHNPGMCREVTPEGEFGDWYKTKDGRKAVGIRWQSFDAIIKAIRLAEAPTNREVSEIVGENHKVRSFYNNLIAPHSPGGDVTVDTHAVAAALLRPLSSSSREVAHNFGTGIPGEGGPTSSNITGATGLYGFYAEAHRRAAKEVGVLPRELQSVTWEAIRGLFKPEDKRTDGAGKDMQIAVERTWNNYAKGTLNADTARQQILQHAGGIEAPSWSVPHSGGDDIQRDSSYAGQLPGSGPSGGGGASGGGTGNGAAPRASSVARGKRGVSKLLRPKTAGQDLATAIKKV